MLEGMAAAYAEQILSAASYCHDRGPHGYSYPVPKGVFKGFTVFVGHCCESVQEYFTGT